MIIQLYDVIFQKKEASDFIAHIPAENAVFLKVIA